jgi:uncharacterized membrane protein YhaH (DUF805 family)
MGTKLGRRRRDDGCAGDFWAASIFGALVTAIIVAAGGTTLPMITGRAVIGIAILLLAVGFIALAALAAAVKSVWRAVRRQFIRRSQ